MCPERKRELPVSEKLIRCCHKQFIINGEIQPGVFMLKKNEQYLSVNWLGKYADLSKSDQIKSCINDFYTKLSLTLTLSDSQKRLKKFAIFSVDSIIDELKNEMNIALELWHFRHDHDSSYAGLFGLPENDLESAVLLLNQVEDFCPGGD